MPTVELGTVDKTDTSPCIHEAYLPAEVRKATDLFSALTTGVLDGGECHGEGEGRTQGQGNAELGPPQS